MTSMSDETASTQTTDKELARWLEWCDQERHKHRIMTIAEYEAWQRGGGDAISSPSEGNPFPGGWTLLFESRPLIFGRTVVQELDDTG